MAPNKKQHYVPQMLQSFFSLDSKTIGCYHIESDRCFQSRISNTAQKNYFYQKDDTDKTSIEHDFGKIEGIIKPILNRLQKKEFNLNVEEVEAIFLFVVAQLMRTPKAAGAMGSVLEFCIQKGIKKVCEEVESGLRKKSNLPMQASMTILRIAELLSGKGYLFINNDTEVKFLLSDNPAILFSPVTEIADEKKITDILFMQAPFSGYMLYMPLGPSVGILFFDDDYYEFKQRICIDVTEADVKMLNSLEVINAGNIIMYQEGSFTPDGIKKAIEERNSEKSHQYQDKIYTPLNNSFSLSGLNLDENVLIYKINRFAMEKAFNWSAREWM